MSLLKSLVLVCVSLLTMTIVFAEENCPISPVNQEIPLSACGEKGEVTTVSELINLLTQNKVLLIDVRSKKEYDIAHIKGAISIPIGEKPELLLKNLAPDCHQKIVIYCENQLKYMSRMVSLSDLGFLSLKALGYKNVTQLETLAKQEKIEEIEKLPLEGEDIEQSPLYRFIQTFRTP